jgi:phage major head subunit gpT-like protein
MAVPATSPQWADLMDPRFAKVFDERYKQLKDMVDTFYTTVTSSPTNADYRESQAGTLGDLSEFVGTVVYDDNAQGYDMTITPKEYTSGYQIERKLYDDAMFGVMDSKPRSLATAYNRTRQKHAAQLFNGAFSVDSTWLSFAEGVALCSNSHTSAHASTSTANGFDNLATGALSAVTLAANRIQMVGFRGDRAERISIEPNTIVLPPNLYETGYEIVESAGKVDTANNNANVHQGRYRVIEWNYLTDVNDWFLIDDVLMKDALRWYERVPIEHAMVEDFDTLVAKWRVYARYGLGYNDWRWILGSSVS